MVNCNSTIVDIRRVQEGTRSTIASKTIAALIAVALGSTILFMVGFSHGELLHAAAHDVRHAAGFPCH